MTQGALDFLRDELSDLEEEIQERRTHLQFMADRLAEGATEIENAEARRESLKEAIDILERTTRTVETRRYR